MNGFPTSFIPPAIKLFGLIFITIFVACHSDRLVVGEDRDGDGVPDALDKFPDNRCEAYDTDGDGLGDNYDEDRDGDGFLDYYERLYGYSDRLRDSRPDSFAVANGYPSLDIDGDGLANGDSRETDCDGDGYLSGREWDYDYDGISNEQDPDADGDGIDNAADDDADGDGRIDDLMVDGLQLGDDNCLVARERMTSKWATAQEEQSCPAMFNSNDLLPFVTPQDRTLPYDNCTLDNLSGWYGGELRTQSRYNCRDCTAYPLPSRILTGAALAGLDFVTLADSGSINGLFDDEFFSDDVLPLRGQTFAGAYGGLIINPRSRIGTHPYPQDFSPLPNDYQYALTRAEIQEAAFLVEYPTAATAAGINLEAGYGGVVVWNGFWNSVTAPNPSMSNEASLAFVFERLAERRMVSPVGAGAIAPFGPGYPTTRIYAANLSPSALVAGIKNGAVTIGASPSGPFVYLDRNSDGGFENAIGQSLPAGTTDLRIRYENATGAVLVIFLNGDLDNQLMQWEVEGTGVCEVDFEAQAGDFIVAMLFEKIDSAAYPELLAEIKNGNGIDIGNYEGIMDGYLADDYIFMTPSRKLMSTLNYFETADGIDYGLGAITGAVIFE